MISKNKKKLAISAIILLSILYADTTLAEQSQMLRNEKAIIVVSSQEELDSILAEIAENNRKVDELWKAAVAQSELEREKTELLFAEASRSPLPRITRTANVQDSQSIPGAGVIVLGQATAQSAHFIHTATFSNTAGMIGNVSAVNVVARTSNDRVSNLSTSHVIMEMGTVLAVRSTMTVSVLGPNSVWHNLPISRFVEFYTNHTGRVF